MILIKDKRERVGIIITSLETRVIIKDVRRDIVKERIWISYLINRETIRREDIITLKRLVRIRE